MKYIFVYCIIPCYRVFDRHALPILFLCDLKTQEYCIRREYRLKKDVSECESYFYWNLFSRIGYLDCKIAKGVYFTLFYWTL